MYKDNIYRLKGRGFWFRYLTLQIDAYTSYWSSRMWKGFEEILYCKLDGVVFRNNREFSC